MTAALGLLRVIPVWCWALCLLLGWGGWQRHRAIAAGQQLAAQQQARAAAELAAERQARAEETRRAAAIAQVANHARTQAQAAAVAAADLRTERDRLREQAQALASNTGRHCDAAAAHRSAAAGAGAAVLAELLDEATASAVELAGEADRRGAAGSACEQAYRAVTGTQ